MQLYLRKIDPAKNQRRFYIMTAAPTLFGAWVLICEHGRIDNHGGRVFVSHHPSEAAALEALEKRRKTKEQRGYEVVPQQMLLPF